MRLLYRQPSVLLKFKMAVKDQHRSRPFQWQGCLAIRPIKPLYGGANRPGIDVISSSSCYGPFGNGGMHTYSPTPSCLHRPFMTTYWLIGTCFMDLHEPHIISDILSIKRRSYFCILNVIKSDICIIRTGQNFVICTKTLVFLTQDVAAYMPLSFC